jgi:hypothetical protein
MPIARRRKHGAEDRVLADGVELTKVIHRAPDVQVPPDQRAAVRLPLPAKVTTT